MSLPPLRPASGSQTSPDPGRTPLDADETALASALHELPASAPSADMDARILAMARDAIAADAMRSARTQGHRRRPARRPQALWWMGTAAGAVMAAGIGWQLGSFGSAEMPVASAPMTEARPAAKPSDDVEILIIPRTISEEALSPSSANSAPAASAPVAERSERAEREPGPRERSTTGRPPPIQTAVMPAPAPPPPTEPPAVARQALQASPSAETADTEAHGPGGDARPQLDRITVTGSRVQSRNGEFPPVAQDFRLAPEDWLQRVRDRRDSGDPDSARRSIREFVRAHPQRVLPKDLRQLLNESP